MYAKKDHKRISEDTERISNSIYTLKMTTKGSLSTQRGYQIVYVRRKDHQRISEHTERISNSICTQKRPSKDLWAHKDDTKHLLYHRYITFVYLQWIIWGPFIVILFLSHSNDIIDYNLRDLTLEMIDDTMSVTMNSRTIYPLVHTSTMWQHRTFHQGLWVRVMMLKTTFNNIAVTSLWSALLVEETGVPGENHRPVASHRQTLSHYVVSSTSRLSGIRTHNVSGYRHWLHR
jgi:hypothetical protein